MSHTSYIQQREAERQRIDEATKAFMARGRQVEQVGTIIRKSPNSMPRGAALRSMTSIKRKGTEKC